MAACLLVFKLFTMRSIRLILDPKLGGEEDKCDVCGEGGSAKDGSVNGRSLVLVLDFEFERWFGGDVDRNGEVRSQGKASC